MMHYLKWIAIGIGLVIAASLIIGIWFFILDLVNRSFGDLAGLIFLILSVGVFLGLIFANASKPVKW